MDINFGQLRGQTCKHPFHDDFYLHFLQFKAPLMYFVLQIYFDTFRLISKEILNKYKNIPIIWYLPERFSILRIFLNMDITSLKSTYNIHYYQGRIPIVVNYPSYVIIMHFGIVYFAWLMHQNSNKHENTLDSFQLHENLRFICIFIGFYRWTLMYQSVAILLAS